MSSLETEQFLVGVRDHNNNEEPHLALHPSWGQVGGFSLMIYANFKKVLDKLFPFPVNSFLPFPDHGDWG